MGSLPNPPRRRPLRVRYPIWSVRTITTVSILIVAIISVLILVIGKRDLLVKAEWITVTVASCLFVFLFIGLYHGVRIRKNEPPPTDFNPIRHGDYTPDMLNMGDLGSGIDGLDTLAGAVLGLVLIVILGVILIFLLPLLLNGVLLVLFLLVLALFWIFRLALRQVFARSRQCQGKLIPSLSYAALFTLLYSGWLLIVLLATRFMNS
jgi:hypothetical protein